MTIKPNVPPAPIREEQETDEDFRARVEAWVAENPGTEAPELDDDGEPILEAGALERVLEGRGYISLRGDLMRCVTGVMSTDATALDAVVRYAENALRSAKAQAAPGQHIDALENEVAVFKATRAFYRALHALEQRAEARAALVVGAGHGAPSGAPQQGRPGR